MSWTFSEFPCFFFSLLKGEVSCELVDPVQLRPWSETRGSMGLPPSTLLLLSLICQALVLRRFNLVTQLRILCCGSFVVESKHWGKSSLVFQIYLCCSKGYIILLYSFFNYFQHISCYIYNSYLLSEKDIHILWIVDLSL